MADYRVQVQGILDDTLVPAIKSLVLQLVDIEKSSTNSLPLKEVGKELNYFNLLKEFLEGYALGDEEVEELFLHQIISLTGGSPLKASSSENAGIVIPVVNPKIDDKFVIYVNGTRSIGSPINIAAGINVFAAQYSEPCHAVRVTYNNNGNLEFGSEGSITVSTSGGAYSLVVEALNEDMHTIYTNTYQVIVS